MVSKSARVERYRHCGIHSRLGRVYEGEFEDDGTGTRRRLIGTGTMTQPNGEQKGTCFAVTERYAVILAHTRARPFRRRFCFGLLGWTMYLRQW